MQPLPHSLQTLVITHSDLHIDLALSKMKELRILICDDTVNLISIPQNLRCLHDPKDYSRFRNAFPKVPEKNELAFVKWSGIKPTYGFWRSFERLTKLETLKLVFNGEKDKLDIFLGRRKCVSNFDKLYMLRDISLRNFDGETISGFSSNLRHLDLHCCRSLRSCPGVGDLLALEELSFRSCPELKELPNLLNLARLQSVRIGGCSFKNVSCLGNLISLRSISIEHCYNLETLPDLHKLTRLETLEVSACQKNVVWAGVSISKSSDSLWVNQPTTGTGMALQSLRLEHVGCRELPNLSLFPELKKLNIGSCRRLERLINTLPMTALEQLDICYCPELQEVPNLSQCRLLRYCDIWRCEKISLIVGWAWVSISKSSDTLWVDQPTTGIGMALQTLRLWDVGCKELPDLSLFPELKKLEIRCCRRLERLISTTPTTALERLNIWGCPELQELPDLSQCRLLRHCVIRFCKKISLTTDEIMKLEAMCPGLKVVFRH